MPAHLKPAPANAGELPFFALFHDTLLEELRKLGAPAEWGVDEIEFLLGIAYMPPITGRSLEASRDKVLASVRRRLGGTELKAAEVRLKRIFSDGEAHSRKRQERFFELYSQCPQAVAEFLIKGVALVELRCEKPVNALAADLTCQPWARKLWSAPLYTESEMSTHGILGNNGAERLYGGLTKRQVMEAKAKARKVLARAAGSRTQRKPRR